jgi:hypothetical protein
MQTLKKQVQKNLALISFGVMFLASNSVIAATDLTAQEKFLKAKASNHEQEVDHSQHSNEPDNGMKFHGVFYGFLPCDNCNGLKMTLSLKDNHNYLLVTQPAKESAREYYEKGKYIWDEANQSVTLTPRNEGDARQYVIKDEGTIVQLKDGQEVKGDLAEKYTLRRSDTVKAREVHIH